MIVKNLLALIALSISLYCNDTLLVLDMSSNQKDAEKQVNRIKSEILNSQYNSNQKGYLPQIKSIKVGERWIVVSDARDRNTTNRLSIKLRKEYPNALIIDNGEEVSRVTTKNISSVERDRGFTVEWIMLVVIGLIGVGGLLFVLSRASNLKKMQDDLENQQKDLMNKILKSEKYV